MGVKKWNKFINHKDFKVWLSYSCLNLSNMNREYIEEEATTLFNKIMEDIKEEAITLFNKIMEDIKEK